jgi:hypothetical protein
LKSKRPIDAHADVVVEQLADERGIALGSKDTPGVVEIGSTKMPIEDPKEPANNLWSFVSLDIHTVPKE